MIAAPALPQAQTGLATIFAALGPATPADSDAGGFEQLLAELPSRVATGTGALPAGPTALTPPSNTPVPAAPSKGVDGETDMVLPMATTLSVAALASATGPLRSQPVTASVQISDASAAAGASLPEASTERPTAPAAKQTGIRADARRRRCREPVDRRGDPARDREARGRCARNGPRKGRRQRRRRR